MQKEKESLIDFVYKAALQEKLQGNNHADHLTSRFSVMNYLEIAKEIKVYMPKGKILDWGCGFGQMSFFLRNLGIEVVSYDVQDNSQKSIMKKLEVNPVVCKETTILPFNDCSFDGVLSCGVLEHVEHEKESLKEIHRILKKNGHFFIYRLPNKFSCTEFIATIRKQSCHPVKYSMKELKNTLLKNKFNVLKIDRENIIPKNLSFLPLKAKSIFNYNCEMWTLIERTMLHIPIVSLFCGALNAISLKQD